MPLFTMGDFSEAMGKGVEEQKHVKEEETKAREARAAMWTTPDLRPLVKPPELDWVEILD